MRAATLLTTLLGLTVVVMYLPRFSARQLEVHRKAQLLRRSAQVRMDQACPVGEERDAFLSRRLDVNAPWLPVCRELPPAAGKVIIEQRSLADYAICREQLQGQSRADCFLDEPLAFLADDRSRTVARLKVADVVWVTPQPLAWGDHLIDEHRGYLLLLMSCMMLGSVVAMAGRHGRAIYVSQRRARPSTGGIPVWAEFWVLFFEHPYTQSFVVDLHDDHERWVDAHGKEQADSLYWLHVRRSLPALILTHIQGWLPVLGRFVR